MTGKPINLSSLWAVEHIYLSLDPGLKHHFPCTLDVWLKPVTIHPFQATPVLRAAITEWDLSTLCQLKSPLEVLKATAEIHQMDSRRPITGGRRSDLEGRDVARGPDAFSKILCGSHEMLRPAASPLLLGISLPLICEANKGLIY